MVSSQSTSSAETTWTPPTASVLSWVAAELHVARVEWVERLLGGTHALTDVLSDGGREVVLRRFEPRDDAVRREVTVLEHLENLGDLAPQLLAADPEGSLNGQPVVVTSRVAGRATLHHRDGEAAAVQLGGALARLHTCPCPDELPDLLRPPRPTPATSTALAHGWGRAWKEPRVLTHQDFWTGNTLWHDGLLMGVVDWSGAGRAPRGFDMSWARLDLVLLHGEERADALVRGYLAAGGEAVEDLHWWDLYAASNAATGIEGWAPNYQNLGRLDLDGPQLRARLETWLRGLTA